MKPEKKTLLARLCAAVLVLLGFASCEKAFNGIFVPVEYGSPSVDFKVKGTITDENENPLEGIRVIVRKNEQNRPSPYDEEDTIYTDAKGKYQSKEFMRVDFVWEQKAYFDDVDGEAHGGVFQSDSMLVKDAPKEHYKEGSGNWYSGGYEYTIDVKLKKKVED